MVYNRDVDIKKIEDNIYKIDGNKNCEDYFKLDNNVYHKFNINNFEELSENFNNLCTGDIIISFDDVKNVLEYITIDIKFDNTLQCSCISMYKTNYTCDHGKLLQDKVSYFIVLMSNDILKLPCNNYSNYNYNYCSITSSINDVNSVLLKIFNIPEQYVINYSDKIIFKKLNECITLNLNTSLSDKQDKLNRINKFDSLNEFKKNMKINNKIYKVYIKKIENLYFLCIKNYYLKNNNIQCNKCIMLFNFDFSIAQFYPSEYFRNFDSVINDIKNNDIIDFFKNEIEINDFVSGKNNFKTSWKKFIKLFNEDINYLLNPLLISKNFNIYNDFFNQIPIIEFKTNDNKLIKSILNNDELLILFNKFIIKNRYYKEILTIKDIDKKYITFEDSIGYIIEDNDIYKKIYIDDIEYIIQADIETRHKIQSSKQIFNKLSLEGE
jgi:hypothetical protein